MDHHRCAPAHQLKNWFELFMCRNLKIEKNYGKKIWIWKFVPDSLFPSIERNIFSNIFLVDQKKWLWYESLCLYACAEKRQATQHVLITKSNKGTPFSEEHTHTFAIPVIYFSGAMRKWVHLISFINGFEMKSISFVHVSVCLSVFWMRMKKKIIQ